MNFNLKRPCKNCPYRKDCLPGWLGRARADELAADVILGDKTFACHKTVNYAKWDEQEDPDEYQHDGTEQFCAGALILEKKANWGGNFSIRLGRMFGGFQYENLKGEDLIFDSVAAFIEHHSNSCRTFNKKTEYMKEATEIKTTVEALPGDQVNVENYRMKPRQWESGEVLDVEIHVRKDGSLWNSYRVRLNRKSRQGNYLFVHVGDDKIFRI